MGKTEMRWANRFGKLILANLIAEQLTSNGRDIRITRAIAEPCTGAIKAIHQDMDLGRIQS